MVIFLSQVDNSLVIKRINFSFTAYNLSILLKGLGDEAHGRMLGYHVQNLDLSPRI